ncbi:MAG: hypothetical protein ACRDPR_22830, partial [Nocardioidaceae bacterium]
GELVFGVTGDYDRAPDIDVLVDGINAGLTELLPTDGHRPRSSGSRKRTKPVHEAGKRARS